MEERERLLRWPAKTPLFPVIPFVFPLLTFLTLMGLTAWFGYRSWQELKAIRQAEEEIVE